MSQALADSSEVRAEDAFDLAAVRDWLRTVGVDLSDGVEVRQFRGGASNLTYSLRDGQHDLILRRPPSGRKAAGAHDMAREYRIQAGLRDAFPLVPEMVGLCQDETVLGSDFYVMQRIDGIIPRRDFPMELDASATATLCRNALDALISLHDVDIAATPLASMYKGMGYVERQISGWTRRFRDARTPDVPDFEGVMAWLAANQPDDVGACMIHNDFRFDNLVLSHQDPTVPIGLLDWELATVGDPLMDLGSTTAYWVQADDDEFSQLFRRQPTHLPGMMSRAELVDYYCAARGLQVSPEQWRFYDVYGVFRLAGIAQQIHYRYYHGQTTNEDLAIFGQAVGHLLNRCEEIIG
ncbi:MAG TPA: phosphotransferase family protein [Marmoricola sp.]|nr:phosphotransferase family protein [Marmoricola sp.]HNI70261.1 phosphotransferase family protein [Marmoricola sp.]HNJ78668.1 phosphotransferase family protein [Marmoricola sp.]